MAEFCLECYNELWGTNKTEQEVILTKYRDPCEGCGQYKPIYICERKHHIRRQLYRKIRPLLMILFFLWRLLILPYLLYKDYKSHKH